MIFEKYYEVRALSYQANFFVKNNRFITSEKLKEFESFIAAETKLEMKRLGLVRCSGLIKMYASFRFKMASNYKKEIDLLKAGKKLYYPETPDFCNIEKPLIDGIAKHLLENDKKIVTKETEKIYSLRDGIYVYLEEIF